MDWSIDKTRQDFFFYFSNYQWNVVIEYFLFTFPGTFHGTSFWVKFCNKKKTLWELIVLSAFHFLCIKKCANFWNASTYLSECCNNRWKKSTWRHDINKRIHVLYILRTLNHTCFVFIMLGRALGLALFGVLFSVSFYQLFGLKSEWFWILLRKELCSFFSRYVIWAK